MAISLSNPFSGFSDARLMNDWLDAVNFLTISQGREPQNTSYLIFHLLLYLISRQWGF
jgi:hypothetical protein